MTDDHVWRDEEKLPVSELSEAMATWDTDGQGDPEQPTGLDRDDTTDPDRESRPSTTGRTGPN
jgi:hypothetical protein